MDREPKLPVNKKEVIPGIDNVNANLEELLSKKFLAKDKITYDDVEKIINEGLPHLDRKDLDYPEKRDDRIAILQPGIEALVERFNSYKDKFRSEGQFEKDDELRGNITDRVKSMLKYFIDMLSENYLEKLEN